MSIIDIVGYTLFVIVGCFCIGVVVHWVKHNIEEDNWLDEMLKQYKNHHDN